MLKGGKPGVLQSTGSQSDTTEQLNQHKARTSTAQSRSMQRAPPAQAWEP